MTTLTASPERQGVVPRSAARWYHTLLKRALQAIVTILIVSVVIFFATQALPGDVAQVILGTEVTPERLATVRSELGLDQPLYIQYLNWLAAAIHGDFGTSLTSGFSVSELIGPRLVNSITLTVCAMVIMLPTALILGMLAANFRDTLFDKIFLGLTIVVNAIPEFVIGVLLIALLGTVVFQIFPPVSLISPGEQPWDHPESLVLPVLTLAVGGIVYLSRLIRISFIDALSSEYIQTARLKGISQTKILLRHALPNALGAAIPAASLVAGLTVGGVIIVEFLFAYPGIGSALIDAIGARDVPVVQAVVLIIAGAYFFFNLLADVFSDRKRRRR